MYDMGLKAAAQGSDYDKARALANKQMETAKNLSYQDARESFRSAPPLRVPIREFMNP